MSDIRSRLTACRYRLIAVAMWLAVALVGLPGVDPAAAVARSIDATALTGAESAIAPPSGGQVVSALQIDDIGDGPEAMAATRRHGASPACRHLTSAPADPAIGLRPRARAHPPRAPPAA